MQLINLDKLKTFQPIILDGKEYKIKGISVGMFLNDSVMENMKKGEVNTKEGMNALIEVLLDVSDIPLEVLMKQEFPILSALLIVAQGGDPTAEPTPETTEGDEKNAESIA